MTEWPESRQTVALGDAGRARIVRAPAAFARLTALHLGSLWTVDRLRHPDTAAALGAFVEANRPLPFEREALRLEPGAPMTFQPASRVRFLQMAISAIGIFTALLAAGFSRFMLGVWPAIMTATVFGGYWVLKFGRPLRNTNF